MATEIKFDELIARVKAELPNGEELAEQYEKMRQENDGLLERVKRLEAMGIKTPEPTKVEPKRIALRYLRHLFAAKGDHEGVQKEAERVKDRSFLDGYEKALTTNEYLTPADFLGAELIPMLHEESEYFKAGPSERPMPGGSFHLPKQTGSVAMTWGGETTAVNAQEPAYNGRVALAAKKGSLVVPISNDLLAYAPGQEVMIEQAIKEDVLGAVSEGLDNQLLIGTGSAIAPTGLSNFAGVNSKAQGGATLQDIFNALVDAVTAPRAAKVKLRKGAWFMNPVVKAGIIKTLDANGNPSVLSKELFEKGTLLGYPVHETTVIPTNLGVGTNESLVLFADMSQVITGIGRSLEFKVLPEGSAYVNSGGQVAASASEDTTPIKCLIALDHAPRRDEAVSVITGVTWHS